MIIDALLVGLENFSGIVSMICELLSQVSKLIVRIDPGSLGLIKALF